jgi:hypothetical protein
MIKPLLLASITVLYSMSAQAQSNTQIVAGWVECAKLLPYDIRVKAKLDTGAKTSSINASNLELFSIDDKQYARFSLTNYDNNTVVFDCPVVRTAKIKRHFGRQQVRPVIELEMCLGKLCKQVEVTLVDRDGFNYQLLLGRNFLAGDVLVDSGATFRISRVA